MLRTKPAVFVVGENYQIMVPTTCETLVSAKVGSEWYYDESNGTMRSDVFVHRVTVPMEELDAAKEYTLHVRKVIERKAYFTETEEPVEYTFAFRPVPAEGARAYHIADTHNMVEPPVKAAAVYGDIDFLILNGDIPDHSGDPNNILTVYEITSRITGGNIPVVFSRGNHDMRGNYADRFCDLVGSDNGLSYFTFRLGSIWGMILDCGEDKDESHPAYGYTNCCHAFRRRQTKFIEKVIRNKDTEYAAPDVRYRMVICHNPFTEVLESPFDIERELYTLWAKLLKEHVKPDMMLCGHMHKLAVSPVGGEKDHLGQPCTVVVGAESWLDPKDLRFQGAGICFDGGGITVTFTGSHDTPIQTHKIK